MSLQTFRFPGAGAEGGRVIREGGLSYHMCKSDSLNSKVIVLEPGVHNVAHAHADEDAHYFVLAGRVKFYGRRDEPLADLGQGEGVLVPHSTPYWFESCGDRAVEMLRVTTPFPASSS